MKKDLVLDDGMALALVMSMTLPVLAVFYFLGRFGYVYNVGPVSGVVALAAASILLPQAVLGGVAERLGVGWRGIVLAGGSLAVLAAGALAGLAPAPGRILVALLGLAALFVFVRAAAASRSKVGLAVWAMGAAVAMLLMSALYNNCAVLQELILQGGYKDDAFMHVLHTEVLRRTGVVSIAVDGLVARAYHYLGYLFIAGLCNLFDMPAGHGVPIVSFLLFVPVLTWLLAACALDIAGERAGGWRRTLGLTLAILFFVPNASRVYRDPTLPVSMMLFAAVMAPYLHALRRELQVTVPVFLFLAFLGTAMMWPVTAAKISTGALFAAFLGFTLFRVAPGTGWRLTLPVLPVAAFALLYGRFSPEASNPMLFSIVGSEHMMEVVNRGDYLVVFNWTMATLLTIAMRLAREGGANPRALAAMVRQGRAMDLEMLAVLWVVALVPGSLFLDMPSNYFVSVLSCLTIPLFAAEFGILVGDAGLAERWRGSRSLVVPFLVLAVLVSPLLVQRATWQVHMALRSMYLNFKKVRPALFSPPAEFLGRYGASAGPAAFVAGLRKFAEGGFVYLPTDGERPARLLLETVRELRLKYGRGLAVYIPVSNVDYWSIAAQCRVKSWLVPAITGVPLVAGQPPLECYEQSPADMESYGWDVFDKRTTDQVLTDEEVAAYGAKRGFTHVYVADSIRDMGANRLVKCRSGQ